MASAPFFQSAALVWKPGSFHRPARILLHAVVYRGYVFKLCRSDVFRACSSAAVLWRSESNGKAGVDAGVKELTPASDLRMQV